MLPMAGRRDVRFSHALRKHPHSRSFLAAAVLRDPAPGSLNTTLRRTKSPVKPGTW
jgi:hypothetical protein